MLEIPNLNNEILYKSGCTLAKSFHLRILNSQLQICKLKMDLKLLIGWVFCLLVYQTQALEWTPGNENQFTWEVPASQASK